MKLKLISGWEDIILDLRRLSIKDMPLYDLGLKYIRNHIKESRKNGFFKFCTYDLEGVTYNEHLDELMLTLSTISLKIKSRSVSFVMKVPMKDILNT